jgi:hypothetical protein
MTGSLALAKHVPDALERFQQPEKSELVAIPHGGWLDVEPGDEYLAEVRLPLWAVVTTLAIVEHLHREAGMRASVVARKRPSWWPATPRADYYLRASYDGPPRRLQLPPSIVRVWRVRGSDEPLIPVHES